MFVVFDMFTAIAETATIPAVSEFHMRMRQISVMPQVVQRWKGPFLLEIVFAFLTLWRLPVFILHKMSLPKNRRK
jgi:hypothetical protein